MSYEIKGYIYILTNPSFPNLVKIGYAKDVERRVKELNRSSCIPFSFRIYGYYKVNTELSDKALHNIIDKINPDLRAIEPQEGNRKERKREFYEMSPEDAFSTDSSFFLVTDLAAEFVVFLAVDLVVVFFVEDFFAVSTTFTLLAILATDSGSPTST